MSVSEAQERIDPEEFTEWMAFNSLEPIGRQMTDTLLAQIPFVIASMFRSKRGRRPRFSDFLPKYGPKKPKSVAAIQASMVRFGTAQNRSASGGRKGKAR